MVPAILGIVEAALSIWASKLKHKYIDEVAEIKKAYYAEINRPPEEFDDDAIARLEFRLRLATSSLAADIKSETT